MCDHRGSLLSQKRDQQREREHRQKTYSTLMKYLDDGEILEIQKATDLINIGKNLQHQSDQGDTALTVAIRCKLLDFALFIFVKVGVFPGTANAAAALSKVLDDNPPGDIDGETLFLGVIHSGLSPTDLSRLWISVLQNDHVNLVNALLADEAFSAFELAAITDDRDRTALDLAAQRCKVALKSGMLLHGRYEVEKRREHESATCIVLFALDYGRHERKPAGAKGAETSRH
jgi:hypothetical protein